MGNVRRTKLIFDLIQSKHDAFDCCVSLFIDDLDLRNMSFHTRRWHSENLRAIRKALDELNYPTSPLEIDKKMIEQCILYWKREKMHSAVTINHRIRSLKQFFNFLIREKFIPDSPVQEIQKLKTSKHLIRPFEELDLRKLFAQPDRSTFVGFRDYTMMLVFLDTGVRLIEMENMRIPSINLVYNRILILGKGSKEREVVFQSRTKEFLNKYLEIRGDLEHDYVWISDRNKPMTRRNIQERLTIYGEKAGLNIRCSPHTFRHTCAKQYIRNGGDAISLQKLLGHASLDMVRQYIYLWGSDLQEMHKKFSPVDRLFNERRP